MPVLKKFLKKGLVRWKQWKDNSKGQRVDNNNTNTINGGDIHFKASTLQEQQTTINDCYENEKVSNCQSGSEEIENRFTF